MRDDDISVYKFTPLLLGFSGMRHDWARSLESITVAMAHGFGTGFGYDNVAIYHSDFIAICVLFYDERGGDR